MLDNGDMTFPDVSPADSLKVPFHIVGDDGFELSRTLMKVATKLTNSHNFVTEKWPYNPEKYNCSD